MAAQSSRALREAESDPEFWERLLLSAVGAHLANAASSGECEVYHWRERGGEVDFVVKSGRAVTAIEVKSSKRRRLPPGMNTFTAACRPVRTLDVGADGIPVEEFLSKPAAHWVAA